MANPYTERRVPGNLGDIIKGISFPLEAVQRTYSSGEDAGRDFAVHVAAAILDLYFTKSGAYGHRHVPQPIGLFGDVKLPEGYAFQAVEGCEGFSWEYQDPATSCRVGVTLEEWSAFKIAFSQAGIEVGKNTFDPDWATTSRNIALDDRLYNGEGSLPSSWVRAVDESLPVDWGQLGRFIREREQDLLHRLGPLTGVLKSAQQAGIGKLYPRQVMNQYYDALRTLGPEPLAALYYAAPNPGR